MIAAIIAAAALAFTPGAAQSFESMSKLPTEWKFVEYAPGVSKASVKTGDAADGKRFLHISSPKPNHARVLVPAPVDLDSTYRFSVMVRVDGGRALPAVLGLEGPDGTNTGPVPGDGRWHERDLYVRTGKSDRINLLLSLGWFGQTEAGAADYDRMELTKVDAAPAGATVASISTADSAAATTAAAPAAPAADEPGHSKLLIPLTILLLLLVAGAGRVLLRGDRDD